MRVRTTRTRLSPYSGAFALSILQPVSDWSARLDLPSYTGSRRRPWPSLAYSGGIPLNAVLDSLGVRNFASLDLGDSRRTRRLIDLVDRMSRHPGGTLPDKLNRPADLRAFYRLMNRPEVTHAALLLGHADQTRCQIAACTNAIVLILHDATELDYTTRTTVSAQMSQIGEGTHRGYICHNSLAVRADTGAVLGLTSQILHQRAVVPKGETVKQKRERENRESRLWIEGTKASGPAPAGSLCVDVSDSLSDTFEYMAHEVTGHRHFVLRARENRRLEEPGRVHRICSRRSGPRRQWPSARWLSCRRRDAAAERRPFRSPLCLCGWRFRASGWATTPRNRWMCGRCGCGRPRRPRAKRTWSGSC